MPNYKTVAKLSDIDAAYIAGLVDGDDVFLRDEVEFLADLLDLIGHGSRLALQIVDLVRPGGSRADLERPPDKGDGHQQ